MRLYRCAVFAVAMLSALPLYAQQIGWGTMRNNQVFRWEGLAHEPTIVPGTLKQVSLGGDGEVWGISPPGDVFRWSGSQWQQMPGNLNQISVGNAGEVWGITPANDLVHWSGTSWDQPIPIKLIFISVGVDGAKVGINADGDVIRRGVSNWEPMGGQKLTRVSVTDAQRILGINSGGELFRWAQSRWEPQIQKRDVPPEAGWDGTRDAVDMPDGTRWRVTEGGYSNWMRQSPDNLWSQGTFAQELAHGHQPPLLINQISVRDTSTASPTPPPTPPSSQITQEQQQALDEHNKERQLLGLPLLVWDPKLAQYAQERANILARNNDTSLTHPSDRGVSNSFKPGEPIGENLYYSSNWSSSGPGTVAPLSEAVLHSQYGWLSEKNSYNYSTNTCAAFCGHYTQMVWRATQLIGCAKQTTTFNGSLYTYIACEYYPAGNTGGKPY